MILNVWKVLPVRVLVPRNRRHNAWNRFFYRRNHARKLGGAPDGELVEIVADLVKNLLTLRTA